MKGWKTLLGGLVGIGGGVYAMTQGHIEQGIALIFGGLSTIGIGHKLDKYGG